MKIARIAFAFLLVACGGSQAAQQGTSPNATARAHGGRPILAGSMRDARTALRFGVYVPVERADARTIAEALARTELADVTLVDKPTPDAPLPWLFIDTPPIADYAPPDIESLAYMSEGLPESEWKAVAGSPQAIVVIVAAEASMVDALHRRTLAYVGKLAEQLKGYPWDDETRQVFSLERWRTQRLSWSDGVPDVGDHMTMHAYRDGELIRIVTLGMSKLGYPDVVVNQVASSDSVTMSHLINLACQTLVEQDGLLKASTLEVSLDRIANPAMQVEQNDGVLPSAQRSASIPVAFVTPEEGDAQNRLIELMFAREEGETLQVTHSRVLGQLYGSHDEMVMVPDDHPEIVAASKRAHAELMKLKPHFMKGTESDEHLLVKAPFRTSDGGTEWMWVELVRWEGTAIYGLLANDPFDVPELKAGARVEVKESEIFDYIHVRPDGTRAGNLTAPIIERLSSARRSK